MTTPVQQAAARALALYCCRRAVIDRYLVKGQGATRKHKLWAAESQLLADAMHSLGVIRIGSSDGPQ